MATASIIPQLLVALKFFFPSLMALLTPAPNRIVKFVHVQCFMDFASLVTVNPHPISMVMRATYYIELPQDTQGLINGNNVLYNLVSFLGVDNLHT